MTTTPRIGLLHTALEHRSTFTRLAAGLADPVELVDRVCPDLLAGARAEGSESTRAQVADSVSDLADDGAAVILCTCSTIGAVAESLSTATVPVLRVDRPMAARAVALAAAGGRIDVLVALASTAEPTLELLRAEAAAAGTEPMIELALVPGAWERWEAGDRAGYLDIVEAAARKSRGDVIVLAQASMAPVAERFRGGRVLASPALGLAAAARLANEVGAPRRD